MNLGRLDIDAMRKAMDDPGWSGPPVVYLLCKPCHPTSQTIGEPEFIAKVTPDPEWSIQRWRTGCFIQFYDNIGANRFYQVEELSIPVAETYIAFGTFPVHNVHGSKMSSFD